MSKVASIMSHLAMQQRLHLTFRHGNENHLLLQWLVAVSLHDQMKAMCPPSGMWDNMEDLQTYIKKLGMSGVIYEEVLP